MSLEARVTLLENKYEALEHAFKENNKIMEATHGVVSMILTDQQSMKQEMFEFKLEVKEQFAQVNKRFDQFEKEVNNRFDQLELLIRQAVVKKAANAAF